MYIIQSSVVVKLSRLLLATFMVRLETSCQLKKKGTVHSLKLEQTSWLQTSFKHLKRDSFQLHFFSDALLTFALSTCSC